MPKGTNDVDEALASLWKLARADAVLAAQEQRAHAEFFGAAAAHSDRPDAAADDLAQHRFREWFLLERVSDDTSAVPLERLTERIDARVAPELAALKAALLNSRAGAFAVSGVQPGTGLWLRDLAGRGEVPVGETEASRELEVDDLIVGRVFPQSDGSFELSRAAGCFRHPDLIAAVERDIERVRGRARGPLRIGQHELERMFFTPTGVASADPAGDARTALVAAGLEADFIAAILSRLQSEPCDPSSWALGTTADALGAILDELAFATNVDLGRVRQILLAAWPQISAAATGQSSAGIALPPQRAARKQRDQRAAPAPTESQADVRKALAEFDDGRRAGRDLDGLFRELEGRLGLEPEGLEDAGALPDFPDVVGAMVVEFLWETHATEPERASRWQDLSLLGQATRNIGVFENLQTADLVRFAAFWLPETRPEVRPAEVIEALRAFARWACDAHQLEELKDADDVLAPLAESLPRVLRANALLPETQTADETGELLELVELQGPLPVLRDRAGTAHERPLPDALVQHLEPGDRLRWSGERVLRVYPAEIALAEPRS